MGVRIWAVGSAVYVDNNGNLFVRQKCDVCGYPIQGIFITEKQDANGTINLNYGAERIVYFTDFSQWQDQGGASLGGDIQTVFDAIVGIVSAQSEVDPALEARVEALEQKQIIGIWYEPITITETSDGQIGTFNLPTNATLITNSLGGATGVIYNTRAGLPIAEEIRDTDPNTTEEWIAVDLQPNGATQADFTILGQLAVGSTPISGAIVYQYVIDTINYNANFDLNNVPVRRKALSVQGIPSVNELAIFNDFETLKSDSQITASLNAVTKFLQIGVTNGDNVTIGKNNNGGFIVIGSDNSGRQFHISTKDGRMGIDPSPFTPSATGKMVFDNKI